MNSETEDFLALVAVIGIVAIFASFLWWVIA